MSRCYLKDNHVLMQQGRSWNMIILPVPEDTLTLEEGLS